MDKHTDVIVVGAGPAGLSAACAARSCGLEVTLLDEQAAPGGQLLRNVESPLAQALMDPRERETGLRLVEEFRQSGARYLPRAVVWGMEGRRLSFSVDNEARCLEAATVILAPGGMERPVPFPGWTLPGVMGAGGAVGPVLGGYIADTFGLRHTYLSTGIVTLLMFAIFLLMVKLFENRH